MKSRLAVFFAPMAIRWLIGVIVVLLVLLGIAAWRADGLSKDKLDLQEQLATETVKHRVTIASVDRLTNDIEQMMSAAMARNMQLVAAREQAAEDAEKLVALERGTDAKLARLRELAKQPRQQSCPIPEALRRELEGL